MFNVEFDGIDLKPPEENLRRSEDHRRRDWGHLELCSGLGDIRPDYNQPTNRRREWSCGGDGIRNNLSLREKRLWTETTSCCNKRGSCSEEERWGRDFR
jgi:hypothetical protein